MQKSLLVGLLAVTACTKQDRHRTNLAAAYDRVILFVEQAAMATTCDDVQAALGRWRLEVAGLSKPEMRYEHSLDPDEISDWKQYLKNFDRRYYEARTAAAPALERCHLPPIDG